MDNHVRHLRGSGNRDAESLQVIGIKMQKLVFGIADVEDCPARSKARTKLFNDCFDERILPTRRNSYLFAGRKSHRDASEFPVTH